MKRFWLALLRWILGPKLTAGLEGGVAAYQAEADKEQAAEVQQIQSRVETQKEAAHAQVVDSADPDAVVNEQLRGLGLVDDGGRDARPTDAFAPADRKAQGG